MTIEMKNNYGIIGLAHVGIPTNDIEKTKLFYQGLGFKLIMETYNEKSDEKVAFLQIGNYCVETYENREAAMADGAYNHIALDVENIENTYKNISDNGYKMLSDGIEFLPFWENGVKFFIIEGTNMERIEFCQKL